MLKQKIAFFESLKNNDGNNQKVLPSYQKPVNSSSVNNDAITVKTPRFDYYETPIAKHESIDFGLNEFGLDSNDNYVIEIINDNGRLQINKIFFKVMQEMLFSSDCNSNDYEQNEIIDSEECGDRESFYDSEPDKVIHFLDEFGSCESIYNNIDNIYDDIYEDLSAFYSKNVQTNNETQGKLKFILDELITTEESYVSKLAIFIHHYKSELESLNENISLVFQNVEDIRYKTSQFLKELQRQSPDAEAIAESFLKSVSLFEVYPQYAINRHRASIYFERYDEYIKEIEGNSHGLPFDLTNCLHIPIQRLGQYCLFLANIQKELLKMDKPVEKVNHALELVKIKMKESNDSIIIDSIDKSLIDLATKGAFITKESFHMIEPMKLEVTAFLFEQVIVFCLDHAKKPDQYLYFDHIDMEDVRADPTLSSKVCTRLCLENFTKRKKEQFRDRYRYILDAKDEKIKKCWLEMIEKVLWNQFEKFKAEQMNKCTMPFSEPLQCYIRTARTRNIFVESFRKTLQLGDQ